MITSSFCLLPGIGRRTERRFWCEGLTTWDAFLRAGHVQGISATRKALFDTELQAAREHLGKQKVGYFARHLAPRHHWRLYEWLRPHAVYLDIETDAYGRITVVGLYAHHGYTPLIRGESLSWRRLAEELAQYRLLVTFCGITFDLPMLLAHFPSLPLEQPHIDLCGVGRQLGYRGGLKVIERQVGIPRAPELDGFTGHDAVRAWNRWRYGRDPVDRDVLLAYNEADCANLQPLADLFYCKLVQGSGLYPPEGAETSRL